MVLWVVLWVTWAAGWCARRAAVGRAQARLALSAGTLTRTPAPRTRTHRPRAERDELLQQGFSNWMRRDFSAFVRACEKYGRAALADIAREIESKTEEEVGSGFIVGWWLVLCCAARAGQQVAGWARWVAGAQARLAPPRMPASLAGSPPIPSTPAPHTAGARVRQGLLAALHRDQRPREGELGG